MRRALASAVVLASLALPVTCTADGPASDATTSSAAAGPAAPSAADLAREAARLRRAIGALPGVTRAEVSVEQDGKSGRAVRGSLTASGDAAALLGVLDRATELGWDTEAFVPQAVELHVLGDDGTTLDATDLGFPGGAATLTLLHARYGAPAADPGLDPTG